MNPESGLTRNDAGESIRGRRRLRVSMAKALMRLRPTVPDTRWGELGEVFNRKEFVDGSPAQRKQTMLEVAEARYQTELRVPYSSYFGSIEIEPFLANRDVLDFGCSNGALMRAVAEQFKPSSITGIDVSRDRLAAARVLFEHIGLEGRFVAYQGDGMPFADNAFDTIYSFDVFEHVPDLPTSMRECFRVLRPGGHLLAVFPSYYHWTEHHLSLVTGMPFIHYLFGRRVLSQAYNELLDERGDEANWYRRTPRDFAAWERSNTINGMTKRRFRRMCTETGFETAAGYPLAIFEIGRLRRRLPILGVMVPIFKGLGSLPILEEFFNHRVVMVLRRPVALSS